jgi:uncharacterized membrane protein HdeD (DUF308 family)
MSDTPDGAKQTDPALKAVTDSWQILALVGVITLIIGILVAAHPTTSLNVICVLFGIIVLIGGLAEVIRSFSAEEAHRALTAIVGVVMIVVGVILIRHLNLSRLLVALVVGVVFIIQGVVELMVGFSGESRRGRWPILTGFVSLAAGIVVIAVPENSVKVLAILVGIWFIVLGLLELVSAFIIRRELKRATTS